MDCLPRGPRVNTRNQTGREPNSGIKLRRYHNNMYVDIALDTYYSYNTWNPEGDRKYHGCEKVYTSSLVATTLGDPINWRRKEDSSWHQAVKVPSVAAFFKNLLHRHNGEGMVTWSLVTTQYLLDEKREGFEVEGKNRRPQHLPLSIRGTAGAGYPFGSKKKTRRHFIWCTMHYTVVAHNMIIQG